MNLGKKISGGRYIRSRKKKLTDIAGQRRIVKLGEEKRRAKRTRGRNRKISLFGARWINVLVEGKMKKLEIKNVMETPSNRFLARQNIITKGAIIETELGKVRVTNRPSQEGLANGILIKS